MKVIWIHYKFDDEQSFQEAFIEELRFSYQRNKQLSDFLWCVVTEDTEDEVFDRLKKTLAENDELFVAEVAPEKMCMKYAKKRFQ